VTGLLVSEFRRALSRRLVRLLVLIAVAGILTAGVVVFLRSSRAPGTRVVRGPGHFVNGVCQPIQVQEGEPFKFAPGEQFCPAEHRVPTTRSFELARLSDREHVSESFLLALAGPLIFAALLAAASMIAVEWRFNTMAVLLTWEPRRLRVLFAKLVAAVVLSFAIALFLQALLGIALAPAAIWHGTTAGLNGGWYRTALWLGTRIASVTALFAVVGFALGSIGRNTTMAMGSAFAYMIAIEAALRAARPKWEGWFITHNVAIIINGSRGAEGRHGLATAALILLLYAAVLTTAATALFIRRDVT